MYEKTLKLREEFEEKNYYVEAAETTNHGNENWTASWTASAAA